MGVNKRIILGIDPGYARVGYGIIVVTGGKISMVDCGVIETVASLDFEQRLKLIYTKLEYLLKTFKPNLVCYEDIFFYKNVKTGIAVSKALGAILLTVVQANIPTLNFTPLQVKQALTGYGRADKQQIQKVIKTVLKLKSMSQPDDVADALAIAICGSQGS